MKMFKKMFTCIIAVIMAFTTFACSPIPPGSPTGPGIDDKRTQIYVYVYNGGYGAAWLNEAKERFEELHKDDVWEEGKKGVQVYIHDSSKSNFNNMQNTIATGTDEIFFGEGGFYYILKNAGLLQDVTDVVTDIMDEYGETRSIEDKLTAEQKEYFGIVESDNQAHYYGLPHYSSQFGFIYNVDLFDELGYYVKKGTSGANVQFIKKTQGELAYGPDGRTGVVGGIDYSEDDGLPATYEEFFTLLEYIAGDQVVPVTWCGYAYQYYLQNMRLSVATDAMGLEEMMLNYTLNGTTDTLCTVNADGSINRLPQKEIVPVNAYELAKQEGWYHSLRFLDELVMNEDYYHTLAFNQGYYHTDAQEDFINAGLDGSTKEMAILMDGTWWESEATAAYNRMVQSMGDEYAKTNRNFKWMPLPKPTQAHVDKAANEVKPYTVYDENNPLCFVKSGIADWKLPLVKEFFKFLHTDVSLREYTVTTNSLRSFDYTMTEADLAKMTTFGRSLVDLKTKANMVFPYSNAKAYVEKQTAYASGAYLANTIVNGTTYSAWVNAFMEKGVSPEDYFNGLYTYSKEFPIVNISGDAL